MGNRTFSTIFALYIYNYMHIKGVGIELHQAIVIAKCFDSKGISQR